MEENSELDVHQELESIESVDKVSAESVDDPVEPMKEPSSDEKPAAFTLVIQSWATPIVGIVMLIVGLFGGYYLRPVLTSTPTPEAVVEEVSETEAAPNIVPTSDTELAAQQQELMAAVVERTRHFRGDPNAPITIIEFSDFL